MNKYSCFENGIYLVCQLLIDAETLMGPGLIGQIAEIAPVSPALVLAKVLPRFLITASVLPKFNIECFFYISPEIRLTPGPHFSIFLLDR